MLENESAFFKKNRVWICLTWHQTTLRPLENIPECLLAYSDNQTPSPHKPTSVSAPFRQGRQHRRTGDFINRHI